MGINIPIIISMISLLIAIISIGLSIKTYCFSKKMRANDKQPLFEPSNSFGGYINIEKRIPKIDLELKNSGGKAIVHKIEDKTGNNNLFCSQLNKSINNKEVLELKINSTIKIQHEELKYDIDIFVKDVDNRMYIQTIKGQNIYYNISPPKEIKNK